MSKKDFLDLENQIRDTMKNALNAMNFEKIKKEIDNRTESTINEVKTNLKSKSQYYNKKIKDKVKNKVKDKYNGFTNITKKDKNEIQSYIAKRPVGSISGILYTILGTVSSGILGVLLITYSIFISFWIEFSITSGVSLGLIFSFFLGSIALTLKGINLRKRVKRFKQYVTLLNNHNFCYIEELAVAIKKKNKFVVKDLRKMIEVGMFPQGHIDDKQTYFMLSNEVYENYLNSQESLRKRNEDELRKQKELSKENDPLKKELRQTIEMGKNYIKQIEDINNSIHREEISTKLYSLQSIVSQIFKHLEQNPKKLHEVSKFTNHYLPITLKLVNVYKDLNDQPVQGDNIRNAKNEIEKTMDTINIAFEKLLDDLFEEIALDISTDISVLETLFTQEGLTKNDFKK